MRSLPTLAIASLAVLTLAGGCANAKAQAALPDASPLMIPQAPSRVVVPPAPDPPPAAVETAPASTSTTTANPPANTSRPNRDPKPQPPPAAPPAATPPATPAAPTTPLETQGNQTELEQRANGLLSSARATLSKINQQALSADGKAQYDAAQRFISQADAALKVKNVVYAWQLADKANTIATLLLKHS